MNKQELIDKWESETGAPIFETRGVTERVPNDDMYTFGYGVARKEILEDLKQLDEPQKPVVPKFVANWYEHHKDNIEFCIQHYLRCFKFQPNDEFKAFMDDLSNKPIETLIRMKDGYEVEQEPLYRVKLGEGYFVEYQGRGALIMIIPDDNKEIKIFDSKSDAERTAQTIGGTVEEVAEG
ncbi:DUF1642 domain-containing protein [Enterococcus faecium]|uniref:DUF1642 domain-containing protein n=1 Tax=Enterococcus faecium TaxID=1352 RepID=UPI000CF2A7CC|nr:DUF1642 domain-containing protein [Enterococcus faecium]EME3512014.1 DUF1642 domain-containing protein [Enterococcus faecium]PQE61722.1 hypothetical protein CUS10_10640 [Enterococcus faecium]